MLRVIFSTNAFAKYDLGWGWTNLFLDWLLDVGSALRFLLGPSGPGVSRGLVVLGFEALGPNTVLIALSVAAPPPPLALFSTLRRFGAGLPLEPPAVDMPSPTPAELSAAGFRDLPLPCDFLDCSCCLPSPSASAAWFLEFFFAASACFRSLLRAAASSASCWAAAESVAAPSRRDRSACVLFDLATLFSR